ncbi:MAG: 23S rRNA (uracil(1939)-C(5))-methyltransferase RlmD [Defluviitaleaceae bacterium]|nr:23S rRNA (uracil(1939)-C(5))-methyltransferase RlmD [Defluviitaleaceae bacterium]MCL2263740.1 23S rRNA (uracil(1939)-C(5))-methyltransferase RlmD [Defluviitaleaceae bacterium]
MLCEHFGRCGGCTYLDISYEEELAIKKQTLTETLGEYASFFEHLHPAPQVEGYRNKMEFAFGDEGKDGGLALGIRKKRSFYEVATPTNCVLIHDDFKKIVTHVINFFRENGETFFHRKRHTGSLRHLVLRRGEFTGEIIVLLSATSNLQTPLDLFAKSLLELPLNGEIVGILHAQNDGVADAVKNENITLLHGRDYYHEKICNLQFKVSAFSFFQTNSRGAEILYEVVRKFAGALPKTMPTQNSPQCALDMYCGTGTIAQIISPAFDKVIGVELIEEAIAAAKENATANGITNCEFHAGDAFATLEALTSQALKFEGEGGLDVIILDPPRDGLHPKALAKIAALSAPQIIYVACKPKSLVRDLPALIGAGYKLAKIEAVDMFPRTPHMEAVALLRHGNFATYYPCTKI